ncbi:MAG: TIGR00303 family protein, partial [Methanosarcinaceae archaeon]|nr:TIGR00303 family protein [Methanosarcinaceae archaeon]
MSWITPEVTCKPENPIFICVLSNTKTAHIPKLSAAGKTAELTDYTPAGDAELMETGNIISVPVLPMTPPLDTPTPAIMTSSALRLTGVPHYFINSGLIATPQVSYIDLEAKPGEDIREKIAVHAPEEIFKRAKAEAEKLRDKTDYVVIGESIPGGTTTAKGVLNALGYDGEVSSSSHENPLKLKNRVVKEAMEASGVSFGSLREDPFRAVATLGDPMMPAVAGLVAGFEGLDIVLAGGTQMAAVFAVIKHLGLDTARISLATTRYVVEDKSANFMEITKALGVANVYAADPGFGKSALPGLHPYETGTIKEGA